MSALVVDASAIVEYVLRTDLGLRIAVTIEAPGISLHTPSLCDVEVVAALRRALLIRDLDEARALLALEAYLDLPLERHGHTMLVERTLQLRDNISAYDATYVALCERLDGALLTADGRLARALAETLPALTVADPAPN